MGKRHDSLARSTPLGRRLRRIGALERLDEATDFINRFHIENGLPEQARRARLSEVRRALRRNDTYAHTPEELAFGARVAWRHHGKCIGRLLWKSLEVIDCRQVADPDAIAEQTFDHLRESLRDGRIRPMISVFPPARPGALPPHIEGLQVTQYAGFSAADGRHIGDRQNIEATRTAQSLGWRKPTNPSRYEMLPMVLRDSRDRRLMYAVPKDSFREIEIRHPKRPELDALALRWYAVPLVSGMILSIGGIDYPCAPFNGFYMGTEIASRDLWDYGRFDLSEEIGSALGEDVRHAADPLWRDRALTVLNEAVLTSFRREGVAIIDHHTQSEQYLEFENRERAAGRVPSADWAWIAPPQASAACPVFHLPMCEYNPLPNFYHSWAVDGRLLKPHYDYQRRSTWQKRIDQSKRRYRDWRRRIE